VTGDVRAPTHRPGWWPGWPKRAFDCVVVAVGLIVLAPLLGVTALAIRLAIGRPVIFAQRRPGRHWRPFILYKFRIMSSAHAADGRLLPDRERLTRLGRLLRRTSIDELPELINVIRGDMSLVGPRPLLMEYLPRYTREQARRHEVRPGIIGWASAQGPEHSTVGDLARRPSRSRRRSPVRTAASEGEIGRVSDTLENGK